MVPIEYATVTSPTAKASFGWKPRRQSFREQNNPWVKIHGRIVAPEGEWSFADESLMVDEIASLAAWLRDVAKGAAPEAGPEFLEPNLRFLAAPAPGGLPTSPLDRIGLRIQFRGEISPPWIRGDAYKVWEEGYWLHLAVTPNQLEAFASDLSRLINR
jgi:hypothetical protein